MYEHALQVLLAAKIQYIILRNRLLVDRIIQLVRNSSDLFLNQVYSFLEWSTVDPATSVNSPFEKSLLLPP